MASLSLSFTSAHTLSLHRRTSKLVSAVSQPRLLQVRAAKLSPRATAAVGSLRYNPLRVSISGSEDSTLMMKKKKDSRRGMTTVCYAAPLSVHTIQWIATISSAILLAVKGTAVQKSFLVPLFALQAPGSFTTWIKGEYGFWTAFLALLVRLFFFIPVELELPLVALLLVIVAPYQVMNLRGRQEGAIISLVIAGYVAFQHFTGIGSLNQSFDRGSIVATLAIICVTVMSLLATVMTFM
ncbi:cold-regulated 413 inner membrane protein 1, chloroplastic-like [Argentina anserina]|uniref:cold-regulated 413 inner membrane protein 1, chloroplastic-like n=1 Tax=Argentina anserina TaxID=57926 RepID=UPI00217690BA|nr:cold-regulated 413 inner membrane protein 1, chloroplastic-like [Potentilla anserina]XP_050370571.1 cold-regulated 413 inner membrane protein 1, chloroplastic-like [Potentilla anserina]XP_050370572.1 cold-regulated 413 inner membrane protein 1, chloroplastic-like [Potentilla anserina]